MTSEAHKQLAQVVAEILERVVEGELDENEALALWPDVEANAVPLIDQAWHELHHYAVDVDIRSKDREYEVLQRGNLRKLIHDIRSKYELT